MTVEGGERNYSEEINEDGNYVQEFPAGAYTLIICNGGEEHKVKKHTMACLIVLCIVLTACSVLGPTWQEQYDLGMRYLTEQNYEEAVVAFTAAIEIDPKQAPVYEGRGDAYVGLTGKTEETHYEEAISDYRTSTELDDSRSNVYLKLGNVCAEAEDYNGAVDAYGSAIVLDGSLIEAYVGRGNAYVELAGASEDDLQYYKDAIADFRAAVNLDGNQPDVYIKLGSAYEITEDYEGAVDA